MKICKQCRDVKPDTAFYASNKSRCKECVKAGVRANRANKLEHYREYDRKRADLPHRVALRRQVAEAVRADEQRRARDALQKQLWQQRNREERRAHIIAGNAISAGKLKPRPCERCGDAVGVQAHHEDYSKPLDVTWLCPPCHGQRHREINEERRKCA